MTLPPSPSAGRLLTIWAVSDGRAGIEAQVVGLANALARQRLAQVVVKRIAWKSWFGRLPWWLVPFPRRLLAAESDIAPPWPDIWVAAGRALTLTLTPPQTLIPPPASFCAAPQPTFNWPAEHRQSSCALPTARRRPM